MPSGGHRKRRMKKSEVPMLIAPSTVISPSRLSQAVSQPVKRLPRMEAQ